VKDRKIKQRQDYHQRWAKVKMGHGGRFIRKKEEAALGSRGGSSRK